MENEKLTTGEKLAFAGITFAIIVEKIVQIGLVISALFILYRCTTGHAETYRVQKDSTGFSHYYDSKGRQTCISKKYANGVVNFYCN